MKAVSCAAAQENSVRLWPTGFRSGQPAAGYEASFVILDGNPVDDITVTRRISDVFLKGERVRRSELFAPAK